MKHSALGRFKHEAANIFVTDDGTVVAYSGDDERFDYMYKFVSSKKIQPGTSPEAIAANMTILDEGTLYVAQLTSDIPDSEIDGSGELPSSGSFAGTGTWIPLLRSGPGGQAESLVDGISPQEVAVFTRFAADKVGATKMDRPEDFEANPVSGKVYVALTNNSDRGAEGKAGPDAANPATTTRTARCSNSPTTTPAPRSPGTCCWCAVIRPQPTPISGFRQDQGQPHLLPGQPGLRQPRQPVDLHRRQRAGLQRRAVRGRAGRSQPR